MLNTRLTITTGPTAVTAAAMVTERLKVGTGVCLVVERDPILLAKEVVSIDRLSGGLQRAAERHHIFR